MKAALTIEEKVERLSREVGGLKNLLETFRKLGAVSLATAMGEARRILEYLVGCILKAEGLEVSDNLLNNIEVLGAYDTRDDQSRKAALKRRKNPSAPIPPPILPRPLYSSLHNLRMYGNLVVHPFDPQTMELKDERLTTTDLQVALGQILRLIEWFFQEYRRPPLEPLYVGTAPPLLGAFSDALPETASFLGRRDELAETLRLLRDPQVRLITVLAPGGMGKTALAARAVQEWTHQWEDGHGAVVWLDLKGTPTFSEASARTLASLQPDARPTDPDIAQLSPAARVGRIVRYMVERPVLLILDNLESWLDPESRTLREPGAAALLEKVGMADHRGCVLLTSRLEMELLGVRVERCGLIRLGPLHVEDAERMLLTQGVRGDPQSMQTVWQRLGGTPRLLLLLGEMLRRRNCTDLAKGLARFPQMLEGAARGLLDELWSDLPAQQQQVLQVMTVLRPPLRSDDLGGVLGRLGPTADSVEEILWTGLLPRALVSHSPETDTFAIEHQLIADHAASHLEDPVRIHRVAMEHFRDRLTALGAGADGGPHLSFVHHARLAGDWETAALALVEGDRWNRLFQRGQVTEAWEACLPLLDDMDRRVSPAARLQLGLFAAHCVERMGEYRAALGWLEKCRAWLGPSAGTKDECWLLRRLGGVQRKLQRYEDAERDLLKGLELANRLDASKSRISLLLGLSDLDRNRGKSREANAWAKQALELADQTDNVELRALARKTLAQTYAGGGYARMRQLYEETLVLADQTSDLTLRAFLLEALADVARREGRYADALVNAQKSIELQVKIRNRTGEGIARHCLGLTLWQMGREHRAEALQELRRSVRLALDLDHPRELANVVSSLARLFAVPDTAAVAVACCLAAADLDQHMGHNRNKYKRQLEQLRQEVEAAGAVNWAAVEQDAQQRQCSLLEEATGIDAYRWGVYLDNLPPVTASA